MHEDVVSQHQVDASELLVALVAGVQTFTRVRSHVALQVVLSTEPFLALWADESLLDVVNGAVLGQLVRSSESLGALLAGVAPLVRMGDHMQLQLTRPSKLLSTLGTAALRTLLNLFTHFPGSSSEKVQHI